MYVVVIIVVVVVVVVVGVMIDAACDLQLYQ
jgi:hypothetical protein